MEGPSVEEVLLKGPNTSVSSKTVEDTFSGGCCSRTLGLGVQVKPVVVFYRH